MVSWKNRDSEVGKNAITNDMNCPTIKASHVLARFPGIELVLIRAWKQGSPASRLYLNEQPLNYAQIATRGPKVAVAGCDVARLRTYWRGAHRAWRCSCFQVSGLGSRYLGMGA